MQQKTEYYHDDMYYDNFSKWLQSMLLPNLPPNHVVVLDNAGYRKVQDNKKTDLLNKLFVDTGHTLVYLLPYYLS